MAPGLVVSFDVGTRNFSFCIVRADPFAVLAWEVIDTYEEGGANSKSNIEGKKRALLRCLQNRRARFAELLAAAGPGAAAVVIEQQPFGRGKGSPTMNILAHVIGTFFLLVAPDPCDPCNPPYEVRQVAARTKLGVSLPDWGADWGADEVPQVDAPAAANVPGDDGPGEACPPADAAVQDAPKRKRRAEYVQYKRNKGMSVKMCRCLLRDRAELSEWVRMFEGSSKKDDLADSFLQALSQMAPDRVQATA